MKRLVTCLTIGLVVLLQSPAAHAASDIYRELDQLANVFEKVKANYVKPVSDEKLIDDAINGMLTGLDPHSSYMPPESFKNMQEQTRGEFGGLGIEVTMDNGVVKVVSPIEDTPADRAGIKPGDMIIKIDNEDVQGMDLSDAVKKMRGPIGSKIKLTIFRPKAKRSTFDVTIVRDKIKIRSVRWKLEDNGVGYVRITSFNEQVEDLMPKALADLKKDNKGKPLSGLVLDLRNNPGGLLNEAIFVVNEFVSGGEIVSTRGRIADQNQVYNAEKGDVLNGKPMVVLINGGSASASEIVSGALQDHKRALIMGTRSFGKGSVQTIVSLPDGAGMRLTTALYYTPSGRSIQAEGIVPDVVVHQAKLEDLDDNQDMYLTEAELQGHLSNPLTPKGKSLNPAISKGGDVTKGSTDAKEGDDAASIHKTGDTTNDYQLRRAVDMVHALALWQKKN